MKINNFMKSAMSTGVIGLMLAAGASAANITFATDGSGTGFNGTSLLTLNSSSGVAATLAFVPDPAMTVGVGNVNYGNFTLACALCTNSVGSTFNAFTFNLEINDITDNAKGVFVGTASAGTLTLISSTITLNWLPLQLGPGTSGASSGNFGGTTFITTGTTRIVNPTSGAQIGSTTVQGTVGPTPEPATFGMLGGALFGLAVLGRKRFAA